MEEDDEYLFKIYYNIREIAETKNAQGKDAFAEILTQRKEAVDNKADSKINISEFMPQ